MVDLAEDHGITEECKDQVGILLDHTISYISSKKLSIQLGKTLLVKGGEKMLLSTLTDRGLLVNVQKPQCKQIQTLGMSLFNIKVLKFEL